ncbi:MAG: J domain-containing protein [Xanthomonadaceae bacterium]|jgi:curved DNA-binding protein CbpA|nr:J domain-containing protein [Xanthomonadaceae bacterium]
MDRGHTHYETLGVVPTASDSVIRARYAALIQSHSRGQFENPEAVQARALLDEAFAVLGNKARRSEYDAALLNAAILRDVVARSRKGPPPLPPVYPLPEADRAKSPPAASFQRIAPAHQPASDNPWNWWWTIIMSVVVVFFGAFSGLIGALIGAALVGGAFKLWGMTQNIAVRVLVILGLAGLAFIGLVLGAIAKYSA